MGGGGIEIIGTSRGEPMRSKRPYASYIEAYIEAYF